MYYFKKLSENYYIYIILIFIFIPINFIPQLFDGVLLDYAYEAGNTSILENSAWWDGRRSHQIVKYAMKYKHICKDLTPWHPA